MIAFPNAKINLGLSVLGKRPDGYHNILSCFYPIPWLDVLEIIESDGFGFKSTGLDIPGGPESNLCVRAYKLLTEEFDLPPVNIILHKVIPMGAGLGGGSADGAFTLKLLNDKFDLGLSEDQLEGYALKLGSDCPFFIRNQPCIVTGTGDIIEPIDLSLKGLTIILVNPGIHISTNEAYGNVRYDQQPVDLHSYLLKARTSDWKEVLKNSFESSIQTISPKIEQIKQALYQSGAVYASMTGSGSTVYGLFEKEIDSDLSWDPQYQVFQARLA